MDICNLFSVFLPVRNCKDDDSTRVCIMRIGIFDPSRYNLSDLIKVALMISEILMLEDDNFTIIGEVIIYYFDSNLVILFRWYLVEKLHFFGTPAKSYLCVVL